MSAPSHYDYDEDETAMSSHLHPSGPPARHRQYHDGQHSPPNAPGLCAKEACLEGQCLINDAMCGVGGSLNFGMDPFHYFGRGDHPGSSVDHMSPYLYSRNAPVGPESCEYCGRRDASSCPSNLPGDCVAHPMFRGRRGGNDPNDGSRQVCPRPKLFFLKKRPPFASQEGWNPVTEYRTEMFERPSSGGGGAYDEVRGQPGQSTACRKRPDRLDSSYAASGCGSSACGAGGAETEVSFSSFGADRKEQEESDATGRSRSPVEWVTSLMTALSPG